MQGNGALKHLGQFPLKSSTFKFLSPLKSSWLMFLIDLLNDLLNHSTESCKSEWEKYKSIEKHSWALYLLWFFYDLLEGWRLMLQRNSKTGRLEKMSWLWFALFLIHITFAVTNLSVCLPFLAYIRISVYSYSSCPGMQKNLGVKEVWNLPTPYLPKKDIVWRHSPGSSNLQVKCEVRVVRKGALPALGNEACRSIRSNSLSALKIGFPCCIFFWVLGIANP